MGRWLIGLAARMVLALAYAAHRADGLNAVFLFLPARFLVPTLRRHGAEIGDGVEMQTPVIFHNVSSTPQRHYSHLHVGSDCYFGKEVFLDLADDIRIEENVTVAMRASLITHTHAGKSPLSKSRLVPQYAPIVLRRGCYIGAGAIILPGVEIGEEAIVGAGAVVTQSIKPGMTVAGVPARPIGCNSEA